MMRAAISLAVLLAVSACAGAPAPKSTTSGPLTKTVRADGTPAGGGFRPPSMQRADGLEGVIGARADQLTASFGDARIDLAEGDARKLQFASDQCVLDIFLYPLEPGATPIATYVEARSPDSGGSLDQASCIRTLARR